MRKLLMSFAVGAAALFIAPDAEANQNCSLRAVIPLSFGVYDPGLVGGVTSEGAISLLCTGTPAPNRQIHLSAGQHATGPWERHLANGDAKLAYQLYRDPQRNEVWGDGTSNSTTQPTQNGRHSYTIYGHMPAGQYAPTGTYTDTITITVVF